MANAQVSVSIPYLQAIAREGEGGISFLKRFEIYNTCNLNQFYRINSLKSGAGLKAGKLYFLPIMLYDYNGSSIRTTLKNNDLDFALGIQAYNERMTALGFKTNDFRKDKLLWVPYHVLHCPEIAEREEESSSGTMSVRDISVPAGTKVGPFSIFGEDYEMVPLRDRSLSGCVFYILSGHGGPDPGAEGAYEGHILHEDEYAYDVALRLSRALLSHGATTYIIVRDPDDGIRDEPFLEEDKDEVCWVDKRIPRDQKLRLRQRTDVVNALFLEHKRKGCTYQRCLDLHLDSEPSTLNMDMSFFFKYRNADGKAFAMNMNNVMEEKYESNQPGRIYKGFIQARDLHVVRETLPVSLLIELGNLHSSRDRKRFTIVANRQFMADWLCAGLMRDADENR